MAGSGSLYRHAVLTRKTLPELIQRMRGAESFISQDGQTVA